jgi:hypothetical protein
MTSQIRNDVTRRLADHFPIGVQSVFYLGMFLGKFPQLLAFPPNKTNKKFPATVQCIRYRLIRPGLTFGAGTPKFVNSPPPNVLKSKLKNVFNTCFASFV